MGIVSAIVALLKAVPSLERLFLKVADGIREAKAKGRYDEKLTHIDNAIRLAGGVKTLTDHPQFHRAAQHAPEWTREALRTVADLEYQIERK